MAKPRIIIFDSPSERVRRSCIASASSFINREYGKSCYITDFFSVVYENVNRMFGLPMSTEAYKDAMFNPTEDFMGDSPYDAYEVINRAICGRYGLGFYGRVLGRKLHRDNIVSFYLLNGLCYTESVQAVALEVKPENVLIVRMDADPCGVHFTKYKDIDDIRHLSFPAVNDYAILRMCVERAIKGFIENDNHQFHGRNEP